MGLLTLLGLRRAPCENCGASSRLIRLVLPDGLLASVCPACKTKFDSVFQDPLDDVEFSRLLKNLQVDGLSVLGLDWGASREVVEKRLPPHGLR